MICYLQDSTNEVNREEGICSKSYMMEHQAEELQQELKAQMQEDDEVSFSSLF